MEIPFLNLQAQYRVLSVEIDAAIKRVLESGWYVLGQECESFEAEFGSYIFEGQVGHVIGVNSGTDALKLSLLACSVQPGDQVVTVANTAIPTVAAICSLGAIPVFCDVDPETWLMSVPSLEEKITSKTRAVIPVHLYGGACDISRIKQVTAPLGIPLVEDVAQAAGSLIGGHKCGSIGDFGAFSFYPTKNLGAIGDGGAIVTTSEESAQLLRQLRNYGQADRYLAETPRGENSRLDELQAAMLRVKLKCIDEWNRKRGELFEYYQEQVNRSGLAVTFQKKTESSQLAPHLCVVKMAQEKRDPVLAGLQREGVQALVHYPLPVYRQKAFAAYYVDDSPETERLCQSILSLPFHPFLERVEIDYVVHTLDKVLASLD